MAFVPCTLGVLVALVLVIGATENELPGTVHQLTASVNTRRLANVLGDEFVSFSAKPQDIFDGQGNPICETSFLMAQSLGRTYLKVVADSSQLHLQTAAGRSVIGGPEDAGLVQIKASAWQAFYEWAQRAGVVPVFVLDYPTDGEGIWDAKRALQVLSAASGLGIEECRWQLGNGNVADGPKYWEDLRTFRTMVKAFPRQRWGVVACEISPHGPLEDIQYFHVNIDILVDAVTVSKPLYGESSWNYSTLQREVHLRGLSKQRPPLWLDLEDQRDDSAQQKQTTCDGRCLRDGLEYARALGEAARGGASAVFKPVRRGAIQQYTLDYLTALLYKRTVGTKVFPVHQEPQQSAVCGRTTVYAYCTRNVTGSVTLVVVNGEESEATNATIKLMTRALSSPVELFLVSVQNGQPMVNNRAFPDGNTAPDLLPVTAVTTLSNGVSFYVPAQTILFAIVPGVQVRECRSNMPSAKWPSESPDAGVPREHDSERTSADVLLQELIGTLLEHSSLEPLQRKRRALPAGSEKRKRFHARLAGAPQDGDLAESLAEALADAQPESAPTERSARGPRQTQAYKRQQRRVRQKEKRVEKRNLRRMKYPLLESQRERTKRGGAQPLLMRRARNHPNHRVHERLLKRMSAKLASRKTKRSSLAEAVNEPPSFGASEEDPQGRSDFPLGDVHLVISKTASGGSSGHRADYRSMDDSEESESVEYRKPERRTPRHRPGVRRRITINQRDFHRFGLGRNERMPSEDSAEIDCKYRRGYRRDEQEMQAKETKRIDRYFPIGIDRSETDSEESNESSTARAELEGQASRKAFAVAQPTASNSVADEDNEEDLEGSAQNDSSEQDQIMSIDEPMDAGMVEPARVASEEMNLFTPAPRTDDDRPVIPWVDPPQWSLESTSAEVAEVLHRRYKRSGLPEESPESHEVERLEDFFRTNAKLQQKFAEMFDLLLEAIEELESEENDAKEDADDEEDDEVSENDAHRRTKRNALLHPQSWESRERSNMIHQRQEESVESKENHVIPVVRSERANSVQTEHPEDTHDQDAQPDGSDEGKPGAFVLRSVVNFVRRATSEFHQLFSGWFNKTS